MKDSTKVLLCALIKKLFDNNLSELDKTKIVELIERIEQGVLQ